MKEAEMRKKIRWKAISIVFQGAMNAMNPVYRVGDQIVESINAHESNVSKKEAKERVSKLFELVGVEPSRADNYPHEFSGGMRQRALIAMSLSCNPSVLIADEPGTALDVIVQAQVLKLLRDLKERLGLGMILITHDLSIIAETCENVAIMYAGKIVEYGEVRNVYKNPLHPYSQGLLSVFPSIKDQKTRMISIPGQPPDLLNPPRGCRFHPRCKYAMDICRKEVPKPTKTAERIVACHLVNPVTKRQEQ
jgi:peptide/nickel transport system ATP-binding protein